MANESRGNHQLDFTKLHIKRSVGESIINKSMAAGLDKLDS